MLPRALARRYRGNPRFSLQGLGSALSGLGNEVDELLDAPEQGGLKVGEARHPRQDVAPGTRDVSLVRVWPASDSHTPCFHSTPRSMTGHAVIPSRAGLTACQMSTNGCPTTRTCEPCGPRITASAMRLSLEPTTR